MIRKSNAISSHLEQCAAIAEIESEIKNIEEEGEKEARGKKQEKKEGKNEDRGIDDDTSQVGLRTGILAVTALLSLRKGTGKSVGRCG